MTVLIANVNTTTDSFGQWVTKTNQIITVISNTAVTTNSNSAIGNAAITGTFTSNTLLVANTGFLRLGRATSNLIANATSITIRTSSTANSIITATGMVIDGVTQYSKTAMTIGNTTVRGANITANSIILNNSFTLGNTYLTGSLIRGQTANVEEINVIYDVTVGNELANTYIDSQALNVYYNNGSFTSNSRMTATTLWIQNIYANTISTTGDTTFNQSVWFRGANNYFDNGLTANSVSNFVNIDVSGDADINNLIVNGTTTLNGAVSIYNNLTSTHYISAANGIFSNVEVQGKEFSFIKPNGSQGVVLGVNSSCTPYTLSLPVADGSPTQYLGTDGDGHLNFYTLSGNSTTNFVAKSIGVGDGVPASGNNGEIRAAGNITAYYSSDERLKENVRNIPNALELIKALNGVEFDWTDDYIDNNGGEDGFFIRKHDIGVIAQEVEEVLPEVVATRNDGYKAVKYERIVAVLIEAVKELSAEVDRLKNGN